MQKFEDLNMILVNHTDKLVNPKLVVIQLLGTHKEQNCALNDEKVQISNAIYNKMSSLVHFR